MIKIDEILSYLDSCGSEYTYEGSKDICVDGFSSLNNYRKGTFTWIKNSENIANVTDIENITLVIIQEGVVSGCPNQIRTMYSKKVFFDIIEEFYEEKDNVKPIGNGTYVSPKVHIGNNVIIGHNCTIDGDIMIEDNTIIFDNVTIINKVHIGQNCTIKSGCRIGHDDLAYTETDNFKKMVKHYGGVKIGDDVNIGANTVINRGTIDNTVIGDNCIIDCLCLVSHNSILERGVTLIAGTMLYGSVHIGNNAYIASGIVKNQLNIGKNAVIGMGSVVTKNIEDAVTVVGVPAKKVDGIK